ncbi:hypothetical protein [Allosphingosinicella indica]|uniref:hypothetical protein n=1 Tax=Allosphingosinicella indica TaxID=941907 RepID=UPI0012F490F3|nr:hypothetical protein [Allosphingosinicella indica]
MGAPILSAGHAPHLAPRLGTMLLRETIVLARLGLGATIGAALRLAGVAAIGACESHAIGARLLSCLLGPFLTPLGPYEIAPRGSTIGAGLATLGAPFTAAATAFGASSIAAATRRAHLALASATPFTAAARLVALGPGVLAAAATVLGFGQRRGDRRRSHKHRDQDLTHHSSFRSKRPI